MTDTRDLKARVSILAVLDKIGARMKMSDAWDDEVQVFCPFCEDARSHKPAGRANDVKGLYFCYGCSFGGDVISLAERHLSRDGGDAWGMYSDFDGAVAWLEENFPATEEDERPWSS